MVFREIFVLSSVSRWAMATMFGRFVFGRSFGCLAPRVTRLGVVTAKPVFKKCLHYQDSEWAR